MATALCPDCGQKIVIGPKPKKGQLISCPHCDVDLEIVSTSPLELDWAAFDEEEGLEGDSGFDDDLWDEDDEDFEDWDDDEDLEDWDEDDEDF